MVIRTTAFPRAALVGNPSDGYFGKTISFTFRNYSAHVELWESPELELLPSRRDHSVFDSVAGLHHDVKMHGYYGGFRLLKASVKAFYDYCLNRGIKLDDRNFTLRYRSDVPNRVGLAGSSAIITSCMRALVGFYHVPISRHSLANLVLSVENNELGIPAGLQDRVSQAYQGLIFMDFDRALMEARGYGHYQVLDLASLPPVYVAFREDLSEGTEVFHSDLRARWTRGDADVVAAMQYWGDLTVQFRDALQRGDNAAMHQLVNANFDKRASLYNVGDGNRDMIATARRQGASANFAGSGGAIVGLYEGEITFQKLTDAFAKKGIRVIRPDFAPPLPAENGSRQDTSTAPLTRS
jgi:glucuronokinase